MPAERYFVPDRFVSGQQLLLEGAEHHHLAHVMRSHQGQLVELVNGIGQLATCHVDAIDKKKTTLTIQHIAEELPPERRLILAQALPRMARLELIMEKGTELGMSELWLFPGARSEKKELSDNQQERLEAIGIAAMKQCGRLHLPNIVWMPPLKAWKELSIKQAYFGDVRKDAPPLPYSTKGDLLFFVGPESGFTDEEVASLEQLGAEGVKLHHNILRTETAAIAAVCLLHFTTEKR